MPYQKGTGTLTRTELKDARQRSSPKAVIVYEAIRQEGEEELARANAALAWSGLAAGLSMGFSFLMEALLTMHIEAAQWRPLLTKFGYCIGFIIVVLGRQQLFTENTLTPILQLLHSKDRQTLAAVARLWTIVLGSNLVGAALFTLLMHAMGGVKADLSAELTSIGLKVYQSPFGDTLLSAVFAGWLIALMIWLLPVAESGRVTIIVLVTYVVGLGGFSHIIAGSVNAFYVLMEGGASLNGFIMRFFIPTLLGNISGGVAFVAVINYAQARPDNEH